MVLWFSCANSKFEGNSNSSISNSWCADNVWIKFVTNFCIESVQFFQVCVFTNFIFQGRWDTVCLDSSFNAETACDLVGAFEKIIYFPYL